MKTIIKNGTVVTSGSSFTADILIEGEKIISIGNCSAEAIRRRGGYACYRCSGEICIFREQ